MGTYGFCRIYVTYSNGVKKEQVESFLNELATDRGLDFDREDLAFFKISSERIQNLDYQCEKVRDIAKKHPCVTELSFNGFIEHDVGVYYNINDEETEE